jgi:hypothetical protein
MLAVNSLMALCPALHPGLSRWKHDLELPCCAPFPALHPGLSRWKHDFGATLLRTVPCSPSGLVPVEARLGATNLLPSRLVSRLARVSGEDFT